MGKRGRVGSECAGRRERSTLGFQQLKRNNIHAELLRKFLENDFQIDLGN